MHTYYRPLEQTSILTLESIKCPEGISRWAVNNDFPSPVRENSLSKYACGQRLRACSEGESEYSAIGNSPYQVSEDGILD